MVPYYLGFNTEREAPNMGLIGHDQIANKPGAAYLIAMDFGTE